MELLLATGNQHKKDEFDSILAPHTCTLPDALGIGFSFEETGLSFLENSLGKAKALFAFAGNRPCIADDSGLVIPALGGAPGIYSARFGETEFSRPLSTSEKNAYVLELMHSRQDRRAFFVCCLSCILDDHRIYTIQETLAGEIVLENPSGSGGFGYDPIFFLPDLGCTVAELLEGEKHRISHRGRAGKALSTLLSTL